VRLPAHARYPWILWKILNCWYVRREVVLCRFSQMTSRETWTPLLPRYQKGQAVRVRPLVCNRHMQETGIVVHVRLDKHGERALDKYVVQFADKDQDEFWSIQLEVETSVDDA
jgi:hypothetical protein